MKSPKWLDFLRKKNSDSVPASTQKTSIITAKCGHALPTHQMKVMVFGHEEEYMLPKSASRPSFCLDCLLKEAVPCAYCGRAIVPGEPVTQLTPNHQVFIPKPGSLSLKGDRHEVIGCFRCAGGLEVLSGAVLRAGKELETNAWFVFEGMAPEPRKQLKCVGV